MYWKTETGEVYPINRLTDMHLVNVYALLKSREYKGEAYLQIRREVERRKLSDEFINGAPYPWFDPVDKVWKKWSNELRTSIVIGE